MGRHAAFRNARLLPVLLVAGICACAADLERSPVGFNPLPAGAAPGILRLPGEVTLTPSTGYSETLPAGSAWQYVGTTPQGEVYRPLGDVFSVEGANRHEAYLVVAGNRVVGFYLPGERAFAPLPQPVPLPIR